MPSFQTDQLIIGGASISATGGVIYVGGAPVFAGSGTSQVQLDALSGYANTLFATTGSLALVSGNLTLTGLQIGLVSGGLETRITASGNSAVAQANANSINLSGVLAQTGATLVTRDANISGAIAALLTTTGQTLLANIVSTSGSLASTGQVLYGNVIAVSGSLATTGQSLYAYATATSGFATGASGSLDTRLTTTGLQFGLLSGGLETRITATGGSAVAQANSVGGTISGNLTTTGATLAALNSSTSGALDTRLTQTGVQLQTLLTSSGTLLSAVKVSGSSVIPIADFSGIGTALVLYSGGKIFISGASFVGGSQADSINVSGQLALTGSTLYNLLTGVSGQALSTTITKQILFNSGGLLDGDTNLLWDATGDSLIIGQATVLNSGNPIAVGGSGLSIQMGIQNTSNKNDASSDVIATSDIGADASGYIDMGINSSIYSQATYNIIGANDGYLYINGGNLAVGTATPSGVIRFHTAGTTSSNLRATISDSGIQMPNSGVISFDIGINITARYIASNSGQLNFTGIANNPIAAMYASGWGNTYYGPALHGRRIKYIGPQITTAQQLWGDTAANLGTLTTPTSERFGEVTLYSPAAGLSCGTSFTTATTFLGTTSGIGNGFFFVSKFSLTGGTGMLAAPAGYPLEGGGYSYPSGSRIFVGLTNNAVDTQTNLHEPAGTYVGLRYMWASGGSVSTGQYMTNWAIGSRDNVNAFTGNLAMEFKTGFYRFAMFCPPWPNNSIVYYQLDDMFRGSGVKGQVTLNLPIGSTALRGMAAKGFVSGLAPIGTSLVYIETPNSTAIG